MFNVALDPSLPQPLHRQLYDAWRASILAGLSAPGDRAPSSRELAASLGVSRSTVNQCYQDLVSEGYLEPRRGAGTYVCQLPDRLHAPVPQTRAAAMRAPAFSAYGRALCAVAPPPPPAPSGVISFRQWRPATDRFPHVEWSRYLARQARHGKRERFDYSTDLLGQRKLREAIARYLGRSRAVRASPGQVLIVNGSQHALDLIARVLLDRGDRVGVEDPGYWGARACFSAYGARLTPVPVDDSGMRTRALPRNLKLLYVTPSHQFPTGAALSLARRLELLDWANSSGTMIVEDDYDSEYRYVGRPLPALQGLGDGGQVLYAGTFSKVMFPALRIGFLVLPPALVETFARARWLTDRQSNAVEQLALAAFIDDGCLERHIRRMRKLYGARLDALRTALDGAFGPRVKIAGESAGMHVMIRLQTKLPDAEVARRALRAGVEVVCARDNYLRPRDTGEFILGFSDLPERSIAEGIARLARALP